jgi:hypothetical protein
MNQRKIEAFLIYLLVSAFLSVATWIFIVVSHFGLPKPYYNDLLRIAPFAFKYSQLSWISWGSILSSFVVSGLLFWLYENYSPAGLNSRNHIRGSQIVEAKRLKRKTSSKKENQITLAGVPVPSSLETLHFLIGGRTGTGKTVAIKEMLSSIIPRGDRVIITDPNGDFLSHFWKKGDSILNPFDRHGKGWSIFNELGSIYDHERYAKSVIPPARSLQEAEWHGYAQLLFAETTKRLMAEKQYRTKELSEWLTLKPAEELAKFLSGTAASGLFDPGAAKALASTRFIITHYLAPHQYLKEGSFSLKAWLKNENGGNLFITWREDMAEALRPLISTWLDILCTSILSLPPSEKRRIWIIIDELASLERLNSLEAALTKGRKHGLRIVTGLQSTAQLENLYGREKAIVLRSCFSNLLILGGTSSDSQTAEDFSRGLGEQDLERIQTSTTQTRQGSQRTKVKQRVRERIVLPSEITNLPTLNGYLSLAGEYPVALVRLKPMDLEQITSPFEE